MVTRELAVETGQLGVLMLVVALFTVQGFLINRLAGVPYPVWAPAPTTREFMGRSP